MRYLKKLAVLCGIPVPRMLLGAPVLTHANLIRSRQTEPHVLRWIADHLSPGDVCFDVGAHHGWMSMIAARKVGRTGKVVAFEPTPLLVKYLSYIKRVNRLSQLEIVPKAVAESDSMQRSFRILDQGDSFMNALVELQVPDDPTRSSSILHVETTTLDSYCELSGLVPNLIKIDTEGAEYLVCKGATRLITSHRPVIVLAMHPLWLPEGQSTEHLFRFLTNAGYRVLDSQLCNYGETQFGDYLLVADRPEPAACP